MKIEIEASSIDELADKLLALGQRLSGEAPAKAAKPRTKTKAEEPVADKEEPKAEEPKAEEPKEETKGAVRLDWDKDVAPKVTGYVEKHGRQFVVEALEGFGVTRASQLPPARWGELLEVLSDKSDAV